METPNGFTTNSSVFSAFQRASKLQGQLESGMKAHPLALTAAIAALSFAGGMLMGSRVARAVMVAVGPAVVYRLLDGPLGDDIARYLRGAFQTRPPSSRSAS